MGLEATIHELREAIEKRKGQEVNDIEDADFEIVLASRALTTAVIDHLGWTQTPIIDPDLQARLRGLFEEALSSMESSEHTEIESFREGIRRKMVTVCEWPQKIDQFRRDLQSRADCR